MKNERGRSKDVLEDDVGGRPRRRSSSSSPSGPKTTPAPAATKCEALFELFRGGAGSVHLGRLQGSGNATQLVALRRLANLPTHELESAIILANRVAHPRLTKVLGTFQHDDSWYLASEYASGVTLFELGQSAVRQRVPVPAPVAVRILLDALTVTAETEQLLRKHVGAARSLYPESIWISDSGKIFMSELVVAPVLARITTGASYVAVTAGMSAQAADVRAAAVELARLACGRLMNGNPASWHTRELPKELSELLARAIVGGKDAETLAAFAHALSALDPRLIAEREAVQETLERLMGPERLRRRERLESFQEQPANTDTTRVFRVAPAPAVPDFANAAISTIPPPDLAAARRTRASTRPPPKPRHTVSPTNPPTPTIPAPPPTPPPPVDRSDSPISGVWREAHERLGELGRLTHRRAQSGEMAAFTSARAPAPVPTAAPTSPAKSQAKASVARKRFVFVTLIVVALSALVGGAWLVQSLHGKSGSARHAP